MSEPSVTPQAAQHAASPAPATPTFVDFLCYTVEPSFRRRPSAERRAAVDEFVAAVKRGVPGVEVRPHLTMGFRADCDFFFWLISKEMETFPAFTAAILGTELGRHLELTHAWPAVTKPSVYSKGHRQHFELGPATAKYLFIYPFTKTHEWYQLPLEKRREMMTVHNEVGHQFPGVLINTCYQFGLGDHDFMLAFETDSPKEFSDLVQRLRETQARVYTTTDIPLIPGVRATIEELVAALALA